MLRKASILICTVAVLGLAAGAHAEMDRYWTGGAGTTNWQDLDNWNPNLPSLNTPDDFYPIGDGVSSPVHITLGGNSTANIAKVRTYNVATTVTIASGSAIYQQPTSGGWNGLAEYSVGYGSGGHHTLNVDGTLTLVSSATPVDVAGRLSIGVDGNGVVNVGSGGQVWLMGTTELRFDPRNSGSSTGTLNIAGPNQFYIEGDHTADSTYLGYISAENNRIYIGGSATGVSMAKVDVGGTTYTTFVPEPATVAILGLGSIALLRRRRV
jgi:hypothetical protein